MKKIIIKISLLAIAIFPLITSAQQYAAVGQTKTLSDLATLIAGYLNIGIYLIMGLAIVMFVWNIFIYYIKGGDKVDRVEAGKYVMWSIIAFFIILSFWGLVNILTTSLNLNSLPPNQFFGNWRGSSGNPFGNQNTNTTVPNSNSNTNIPSNNSNTSYGPN